ncbi:hypothetical protein TRAPUB_6878 [Trametes pubescens]|uniref:Uncharacterized protein n=1 Tax=Trametes pubescens TaxID=154538 RepID=A0A1M2V4T8_TRAPU|nr:hypothetical protein TRAPUB_6878 [Trametes pubescens]
MKFGAESTVMDTQRSAVKPAIADTGPEYPSLAQILRADRWGRPYYGLPPVASGAAPSDEPAGEAGLPPSKRSPEPESELCDLARLALFNARIPINTLPIELLAMIFEMELKAEIYPGIFETYYPWLDYLLVCRHWFAVGATVPRLWTRVYAGPSLNYARTCLARSKAVKIDISGGDPPWLIVPRMVFHLVTPHLHRIRKLELGCVSPEDAPHLNTFLQHMLPTLEVLGLGISYNAAESTAQAIELSPEHFQKLVHVWVYGIRLVSTTALRRLKVLRITDRLGSNPVTTLDILTALLRELVAVEELGIYNVLCRDAATPPLHPCASPTALSNLRELNLYNTDLRVTRHILSVISVPLSAVVQVIGHTDLAAAPDAIEAAVLQGTRIVLPADTSSLPMLSRATHASIEMSSCIHTVSLSMCGPPTPREKGRLYFYMAAPSDYRGTNPSFADFVSICGHAALEALRIETETDLCPHLRWRHALAYFNGTLRELTVRGSQAKPGAAYLFVALDPDTAPVGTRAAEAVVVPHLRKLRVEGFAAHDGTLLPAVVECLQQRRDALGRPLALEALEFQLEGFGTREFFEEQRALYTDTLSEYVEVLSYVFELESDQSVVY